MIIIVIAAFVITFVSMFAAILLGGSTPIVIMTCAIVIAWAAVKIEETKNHKAVAKWQPVGYRVKTWGA